MASCFSSMNINDFLRFMDKPNSQARIIEEYNSIVSKQEKETRHKLNKKLEIIGCFSSLKFPHHSPRSRSLVIPGASFIDGYETKRKFICTKNPNEKESEMFWQTVWDNKVEIIVMTCKLTDKSYQYWSPKEDYVLAGKKFQIATWAIMINSHYTLTLLTLTTSERKPKQRRMIFHYQYTAWPRDKFPHQPDAFIDFYNFVNDTYVKLKSRITEKKFPPILVHCLDGVGSSSVFCALDICITQFDRTGMLSLPNVLYKMQEQKHESINRSDLYALCYQLVKNYLDRIKSIM
ncbi:protein tyrosine phosphatase [Cotesia plutellae polydnavirus]|nr:protein tyrosine phosphatase [Cotesia plutellae polydnavirus]AEE09503.1 protein tyrosine phosphatase [Cotesia vestalis bracovirus]